MQVALKLAAGLASRILPDARLQIQSQKELSGHILRPTKTIDLLNYFGGTARLLSGRDVAGSRVPFEGRKVFCLVRLLFSRAIGAQFENQDAHA